MKHGIAGITTALTLALLSSAACASTGMSAPSFPIGNGFTGSTNGFLPTTLGNCKAMTAQLRNVLSKSNNPRLNLSVVIIHKEGWTYFTKGILALNVPGEGSRRYFEDRIAGNLDRGQVMALAMDCTQQVGLPAGAIDYSIRSDDN